MPVLPLDYPYPYAATFGVMHYPAEDPVEHQHAKSFASQYVRDWLPLVYRIGSSFSDKELNRVLDDASAPPEDVRSRLKRGILTGLMFRVFHALANADSALATWANVTRLMMTKESKSGASVSKSTLYAARAHSASVAHLWAAWTIRDEEMRTDFRPPPAGQEEFQSFLAESEVLRSWGQTWRHERDKAEPPLPADVWRVPDDWEPPGHQTGWGQTGEIPHLDLSPELISELRPAGRPKKSDP